MLKSHKAGSRRHIFCAALHSADSRPRALQVNKCDAVMKYVQAAVVPKRN